MMHPQPVPCDVEDVPGLLLCSPDVLERVCSFLSPKDAIAARQACKALRDATGFTQLTVGSIHWAHDQVRAVLQGVRQVGSCQ